MHLRRIAIRNYRSIVKADLVFGHITVLIGPSDVGKSNLVRALRDWANYTSATDIVTHGQEVVRVAVAVGEQHKVVFEKVVKRTKAGDRPPKVKARYVVKDGETGKVLSYEKIGRQVPNEIIEITGIRPVQVGEKGDSDLLRLKVHFSEQAEDWFLVGRNWTPSQISKVIGKISGVDALILANRDLVNERVACNRESKSLRTRINEGEQNLADYDGLDRAVEALDQIEVLLSEVVEDERAVAESMTLLKRVRDKRLAKEQSESALVLVTRVVEFVDDCGLLDDYEVLGEATLLLDEIEEREAALGAEAETAETQEAVLEFVDHCDLLAEFDLLANVTDIERALSMRVHDQERALRAAQAAQDRVDALGADLEGLADSGALTCPLCGLGAHAECREALRQEGELVRSQG